MRKFFAAVLMVICLACLSAVAVACNQQPVYYTLTYEEIDGISFDFRGIESGAEVREGYVVYFTLTVDESKLTGDAKPTVNGEVEYPDLEGVYSFTMTQDTVVSVSGVFGLSSYNVTFDKGDWRINYLDENGNELSELKKVDEGTKLSFTLDMSVYYDKNSDYSILANTNILTPVNGVYSFTVTRETVVSVSGLELEKSFIELENRGTGTEKDPYIIERPIDLYVIADLVANTFYVDPTFRTSYFKLNDDIDMGGEQLYVIGDASSTLSFFGGHFNGNGHTIRNYYISDTIIDQSEFIEQFVPYLGLFGQVGATVGNIAEIYDLNLEDFTINVNADKFNATFAAGGVAGLVIGGEIRNCKVSGTIVADADDNYFGYIGGIAGFVQSAYSEGVANFHAAITGCSTDVMIEGQSGYLYSAGGIAGQVMSTEQTASAYIYNCYSNGSVAGAMNAGGIVGYLGNYSSVKNCYSTGEVNAYNSISPTIGYYDIAYAYAGGIAGYADFDSIVSNCFSVSGVYASAAQSSYAKSDAIVAGKSNGGGENIESSAALVLNCTSSANNINQNYLTSTLGWSTDDWTFGGDYPELKASASDKTVVINISFVGVNLASDTKTLTSENYLPVSEWYLNGIDRFVTNAGLRSFGYYFDSNLTQKVPYGYVFTGNETVYCGFADYSEVAGVYYLQTDVNGSGIYVEFTLDGVVIYRDGGLNATSEYIYDGNTITVYYSPLFAVTEVDSSDPDNPVTNSYYSCGIATLEDGVLTLVNNLNYTQNSPMYAVKEIENFVYGEYYTDNGANEYTFYTDGRGLVNETAITYTVNGGVLTIYSNNTIIARGVVADGLVVSINSASVNLYDEYKGTWESSATSHVEYTFDGKGGWSYENYAYVNGNKVVYNSDGGVYTLNSDGSLTLDNDAVVSLDKNGFLTVNTNYTQTYFKPSSLVGTWRFFYKNESIELTFEGIGANGYGTAYVTYQSLSEAIELTYDVRTESDGVNYVYLYNQDVLLGMLHFDPTDYTLKGAIYSVIEQEMLYMYEVRNGETDSDGNPVVLDRFTFVSFCLYDEFSGDWISSEWGTVNFNGFGAYNLGSIQDSYTKEVITLIVNGNVTVNGTTVSYSLTNGTMNGSFVYNNVTYSISYNYEDNSVTVSGGGNTFKMYRADRLYGVSLQTNGVVYSFDGGSALEGGGKVKVSNGANYRYTIVDGKINLSGNTGSVGVIEIINDEYVLTLGGQQAVTLHIVTPFTGSWLVGGTLETLVIGEISASNTAHGTYLGNNVTFNYEVSENMLSYVYGGATYYLHAMTSVNGTELRLSDSADLLYGNSVYCISAQKPDNYRGQYTAADGSYIILDGLGNSAYGGGTAVMSDGENSVTYSYNENEFGMIRLVGETTYVLVPVNVGTQGAYTFGTKAFLLYQPDRIYLAKAVDYYGVTYTFDGISSVKTSDGRVFSYVFNSTDELNYVYKLTLLDASNNKYAVNLDYSSGSYKLVYTDDITGVNITPLISGFTGTGVNYNFVDKGLVIVTYPATEEGADATSVECSYEYVKTVKGEETIYTITINSPYGDLELVLATKDGIIFGVPEQD